MKSSLRLLAFASVRPGRLLSSTLALAAVLFHPSRAPGWEVDFSGKTASVKNSVAAAKAMKSSGAGFSLSLASTPWHSLVGEIGYSNLQFSSRRSVSGATEWIETSRSGNVSIGYPVPAKEATISSHGAHVQAGYRFPVTRPAPGERRLALLADLSLGYRGLLATSREAGDNTNSYTNRRVEKMELQGGAYVQPRLLLIFGTRPDSQFGLRLVHESHLSGDLGPSWGAGLVYGRRF